VETGGGGGVVGAGEWWGREEEKEQEAPTGGGSDGRTCGAGHCAHFGCGVHQRGAGRRTALVTGWAGASDDVLQRDVRVSRQVKG
jgi:hypothetical protein